MRHAKALEEALEKEYQRRGLYDTFGSDCLWPEPYNHDTYEAARDFVYKLKTYNEANREIEPIAQKDYLDWSTWHWFDTRQKGQGLITWKSRRLVYSWWNRGLELWDGGLSRAAFQLGAKTYEGEAGSQAFIWRYWHLYEQLRRDCPKWNLPKPIPGGNPIRGELESLVLANGSRFSPINSEKESFRGSGTASAICEELSSYRAVKAVWAQAVIVCQGRPGQIGGHPVGIANTDPNTEWMELKAKSYIDPDWPEPPMGCEAWETPDGVRVLKIHYSADPEKDAAWAVATRHGIPTDEWEREMELNEAIEDGEPVFPSYDDEFHCPMRFRREQIPLNTAATFIGSWDCGQTLSPAFVLTQISPKQKQLQYILEVTSPGGESMANFAPRVYDALLRRCPDIIERIEHVGDETVNSRSGTDGKSAADEARKSGFNIKPVTNVFEARKSAGAWALTRYLDDELPGAIVDGVNCPLLRQALAGKYKYKISASGDSSGPGRILMKPLKNMYSHVGEAWAYGQIKAREKIEGKKKGKIASTIRFGRQPEQARM